MKKSKRMTLSCILLTGGISSKGVLFGVISMSLMLNIEDDVCRRFLRLSLACVLVAQREVKKFSSE